MSQPDASPPEPNRSPTVNLSVLHSLLARWAQAEEQGRPVPVDELTDDPAMREELRRRIELNVAIPIEGGAATRTNDSTRVSTSVAVERPTIPGYEILEEVGRGGMGIVYRACDLTLMRDVAVKVLHAEYAGSASARRRFEEESRITGQLQHPGIPPVHAVGSLPDGRPYLAMKLVKGQTLDDLLKQRPTPADGHGRFVAVFDQVCQAVGYAHSRGVIHRDLKPGNVMVGAFGEVQVMDWGLAKVLGKADADADTKGSPELTKIRDPRAGSGSSGTQAGSVVGTPAFMPPEQAAGAINAVDQRSDVFGLGGILCAILTGQPPFVGPDSEAVRLQAAKGKIEDAHSRLDRCDGGGDLAALAKSCLSPEPVDRPADAGAVAFQVGQFRLEAEQRARQAELDRATAVIRTSEERKRRKVQLAFAVAVLFAVLAVGISMRRVGREREERRVAAVEAVSGALVKTELLRDQATKLDGDARTESAAAGAVALWDRCADTLEEVQSRLDSELQGDLELTQRAKVLRTEVTERRAAAQATTERVRKREAFLRDAQRLEQMDQQTQAAEAARLAIAVDPKEPSSYHRLGKTLVRMRRYDDAIAAFRRAALFSAAIKDNGERLSFELTCRVSEKWAKAFSKYEHQFERFVRDLDRPSAVEDVLVVALMCQVHGYYRRSVDLYRQAFRESRQLMADTEAPHLFAAADAAAEAGRGLGRDAAELTEGDRQSHFELSVLWFEQDLSQIRKEDSKKAVAIDGVGDMVRERFSFLSRAESLTHDIIKPRTPMVPPSPADMLAKKAEFIFIYSIQMLGRKVRVQFKDIADQL